VSICCIKHPPTPCFWFQVVKREQRYESHLISSKRFQVVCLLLLPLRNSRSPAFSSPHPLSHVKETMKKRKPLRLRFAGRPKWNEKNINTCERYFFWPPPFDGERWREAGGHNLCRLKQKKNNGISGLTRAIYI